MCTYLCRLCTPPSIWAEAVLFSNFRSPEYIMALGKESSLYYPGCLFQYPVQSLFCFFTSAVFTQP
uniref:Uncharacterized protein n=1 Tax=Anguilla anguilla TaxID=7936 RepID=A0A0E9W1N1_ANGAN